MLLQDQESTPLFSVLIANYNNTRYLKDAISSVIKQTYPNWEIIVVDDHSTDNPDKLYNEIIKDTRIRVFKNDKNRKTAYTFKRALDKSTGDYFGFLGPDDMLAENAIMETVTCHLAKPDCSIVYTQNYICDERMNIESLNPWGGHLPKSESQLTAPSGQKITSFATFKRKYYKNTLGIDIKFTRGFDQDLYYKMEEVGSVQFINKPLYFYRQHDNNISLNENNIKAWYWLYVANKDAYYRRRKNKLNIKNTTFGELQRTYIKVCLLKIDQKFRLGSRRNLCYYYANTIARIFWDKDLLIFRSKLFFIKRWLNKLINKKVYQPLYFKY